MGSGVWRPQAASPRESAHRPHYRRRIRNGRSRRMALILDTNAVSAFADGDRELRLAIGRERNLAAPAVVLGEYLFGIRQSRHRPQYERWLKAHLPLLSLLPIDSGTAGS